MKSSGFQISRIAALSGTGQVSIQSAKVYCDKHSLHKKNHLVSGCRPDRDINTNMIYQMYYMNAL